MILLTVTFDCVGEDERYVMIVPALRLSLYVLVWLSRMTVLSGSFAEGFVPVDQAHANCEAATTYRARGGYPRSDYIYPFSDTVESLAANIFLLAIGLVQLIYLILHVLAVRLRRVGDSDSGRSM
jgi:hypothetical protein